MGRWACRWEETEISKAGVTQGVVIGGGLGQQHWRTRQSASDFLWQLTGWTVHSRHQSLLSCCGVPNLQQLQRGHLLEGKVYSKPER